MKRPGRIPRWIGIATAAAIVVLLAFNTNFVWGVRARLDRRLKSLGDAGDPVRLSDLTRAPIPSEQNADEFFQKTVADLVAMQKALSVWYPDRGYPTGTLSLAEQDRPATLFKAHRNVFPLLEQAAACSDNDPKLDATITTSAFLEPLLAHLSPHRSACRVIRARSTLLLSQGRPDDALASQVLMLRLTRHWRREPMIMGYMVTAVCEAVAMDGVNQVLQASPVASSARQALDAELALHDTMDGLDWALRSERAYALS